MSQDRFTLFEKVTTGKLMEAISKSMDDFLYIFDIQNSKLTYCAISNKTFKNL